MPSNSNDDIPPQSLLVASACITAFVIVLMLNAWFGVTFHYSHKDLRSIFTRTETVVSFVHYGVFLWLFELIVIWGPGLNLAIAPNSVSVVVTWLVINSFTLSILAVSFFSKGSYRMVIHVSQCIRVPLAVLVLCDRFINHSVGAEGVVIAALFMCSAFEISHIHHMPVERTLSFTVVPPIVTEKISKRRARRVKRSLNQSASQSASVSHSAPISPKKRSVDSDDASEIESLSLEYNSDVPMRVRQGLAIQNAQLALVNDKRNKDRQSTDT